MFAVLCFLVDAVVFVAVVFVFVCVGVVCFGVVAAFVFWCVVVCLRSVFVWVYVWVWLVCVFALWADNPFYKVWVYSEQAYHRGW